jgi:hypothetical protein
MVYQKDKIMLHTTICSSIDSTTTFFFTPSTCMCVLGSYRLSPSPSPPLTITLLQILMDRSNRVVAYELLAAVLEYQTAVVRGDFELANELLVNVPEVRTIYRLLVL